MPTTVSLCPYCHFYTHHNVSTHCSIGYSTVNCDYCPKIFHRCNFSGCTETRKFPCLIHDHINRIHPSNGLTSDDSADESVAGAASFNGDAAESCSVEAHDVLPQAAAVQTGKSDEHEMADAESSSDESDIFDCPYELVDANCKEDDPDVVLVDNFIGNQPTNQLQSQPPETVLVDGPKLDDVSPLKSHHSNCRSSSYFGDRLVNPSEFAYMKGERNRAFYAREHNEYFGGIRGLVHLANDPKCTTDKSCASFSDTRYAFSALDNLFLKPESEQLKFLKHQQYTCRKYAPATLNSVVDTPRDIGSANRLLLKGAHSVITNTPCPHVFMRAKHACVRITDLINHVCADGTEFEFMQDHTGKRNSDGLNGTPAAAKLLQDMIRDNDNKTENCAFGYILLWSDSFLRCFIRQKNNSIWILVIRICPPSGKSKGKCHTFCLAMGRSKDPHGKVIDMYLEEIETIRRGQVRYYGEKRIKINTFFDMLLYVADTPERKKLLDFLDGGHYGKRSLYAGRINGKLLSCCDTCHNRMIELSRGTITDETDTSFVDECPRDKCLGWNYDSKSRLMDKYDVDVKDFPTASSSSSPPCPEYRSPGEKNIRPRKQDFEWLCKGIRLAFYMMSHGLWSKKEVRKFLASMAISKSRQNILANIKMWRINDNVGEEFDAEKYIPYLWRSKYFRSEKFIETGMHLLGHGIIGSLVELLEKVFTDHKLWSKFVEFANKILVDVASFSLDWCKVKLLPKANWLGEDCFGFGRLMLYIVNQFLSKHDLTKLPFNTTEEQVESLKELLNSFTAMLYSVMCKDHVPKKTHDLQIKIFLTCCHRFCKVYYSESVTEFWANTCNFPGLLNLTDQIELFGGITLSWDATFETVIGDIKGEGILRSARQNPESLLPRMVLLQKKYVIDKTFRRLEWHEQRQGRAGEDDLDEPNFKKRRTLDGYVAIDHRKRTDLEDDDNDYSPRYYGVRIYRTEQDVMERFQQGRCLSGFMVKGIDRLVWVPYSFGGSRAKCLLFAHGQPKQSDMIGGIQFTTFKQFVEPRIMTEFAKREKPGDRKFCMMLPSNFLGSNFDSKFALLTGEWRVMNNDGNLGRWKV